MKKNGDRENIVELWGQEFNLAQKGLDENQVVPFVNEIITERDRLVKHEEHVSSLTKLAERTVTEADKIAEDIRKEAREKAEEEAKKIVEEERNKVITAANEEAEKIKADAEQEAEALLENQRKRIQPEIRKMAQEIRDQLLAQLESLKQQVEASGAELESKLLQPEEASPVSVEEEPTPAPVAPQEENVTTPDAASEVKQEDAGNIFYEPQQLVQTIDLTDVSRQEEGKPAPVDSQSAKKTYEGEVEVEVLPPVDIMKIMKITKHLETLPEVESTELIPIADRPLIMTLLREPLPLADILVALPEVDQVKEDPNGESEAIAGADYLTNGQKNRIQITLSSNSVADKA
ncbi:MAG: hypothetical protein E3J67_03795 [Dehalococcoidia bacterium]|nr:MAG: hypothetical protein E3J67_03795 [Dehalococcoidia bacterium]